MKFAPNERVLRVALLVFSLCFGVLSICMVALGVVYTNDLGWPRRYIGLDFLELPTLIIILGAVSLVLAVAGCICAKSYSRPLLLFFGITLCVILCLELAIAVIAFENAGDTRRAKTQALMLAQYTNGSEAYFQTIEEHYCCCGVTGQEEKCMLNYNPKTISGCASAVNKILDNASISIGYTAVVLSLLQPFAVAFIKGGIILLELEVEVKYAPPLFFCIGSLLFLLCLIGIIGTLWNIYCLLILVCVLSVLFFFHLLAMGITIISVAGPIVETHLIRAYMNRTDREFIDKLQIQILCCGLNGPSDKEVQEVKGKKGTLIKTCCPVSPIPCTLKHAHSRGCLSAANSLVVQHETAYTIESVVCLTIAHISGLLAWQIRRKKRSGYLE